MDIIKVCYEKAFGQSCNIQNMNRLTLERHPMNGNTAVKPSVIPVPFVNMNQFTLERSL